MRISNVAAAMETSLTRQLFNIAKGYNDVVDLTLGDPDVKPSQIIRDTACKAIQEGKTRYSVNAGMKEARAVLAENFGKEYGVAIDPEKQIMLTTGGMGALYIGLKALINPSDEVIVLAPYYVNYIQMIQMSGGVPVVVYGDAAKGFAVDPEEVRKAVTDKTVAIMINSPCNPTGQIVSSEVLDELAKIAVEKDLAIISDEVYRTLTFDGRKHESIITRKGMLERTILVDSLSKRFAMTGYRAGYAIAPEEMIACMTKMQENIASCTSLPSQYAAIAAYTECSEDTTICETFEERRNYICSRLEKMDKVSFNRPQATFYIFVDISATGMNSVDFAYKFLESAHVAVVPGVTYGKEYMNFIRIAYTMDISKLEIAMDRMEKFLREI